MTGVKRTWKGSQRRGKIFGSASSDRVGKWVSRASHPKDLQLLVLEFGLAFDNDLTLQRLNILVFERQLEVYKAVQ
jgi:hypothetical protein